MAPGDKSKCMFWADDRAWGWVYRIVSASITWNFTLRVSVSSGGQTADCPPISWSVTETWQTVNGQLFATGSANVITRP
jgi:hypothetical protein